MSKTDQFRFKNHRVSFTLSNELWFNNHFWISIFKLFNTCNHSQGPLLEYLNTKFRYLFWIPYIIRLYVYLKNCKFQRYYIILQMYYRLLTFLNLISCNIRVEFLTQTIKGVYSGTAFVINCNTINKLESLANKAKKCSLKIQSVLTTCDRSNTRHCAYTALDVYVSMILLLWR